MTKFEFKPVKRILVPTDFSSAAEHALDYACQFARSIDASILIFHSVQIPIVALNEQVDVLPFDELEKTTKQQLENLKRKYKSKYIELDFEIYSSLGFAVQEIVSAATSKRADLIVMGTRGANGLQEFFFGSNTAQVMEKAEQPVLSIPSEASFKEFSEVIFATDYHDNDFQTLYLLATLMKPFRARINVLHVEDASELKLEARVFKWFETQVMNNIPYDNFSFHFIKGVDVAEELDKFILENKTNLVALSMRKRSFFQKLFTKSITKKMAYHTRIPVLAFHAKTISS
jgi:nucleotide-binding universal stress UspA family protein